MEKETPEQKIARLEALLEQAGLKGIVQIKVRGGCDE